MKFQIGDKVVVQHSNEEAEVVEIIDKKMVMLDIRGVKFPAYIDQLDFPYFKRFTEKKVTEVKAPRKFIDHIATEKISKDQKIATGVWLNFIPVFENDDFGDDIVAGLKIHLLNNTAVALVFAYDLEYAGKPGFSLKNEIPAFSNFYLHDIPFENLNDAPVFSVDFSLVIPDKNKAAHIERTLKLKAKQVFDKIETIKKKGEPGFSYELFAVYPERAPEPEVDKPALANAGFRIYDASKARQHLPPARQEVDLHIEKLTDDWQQLDNFEILTIQLQALEKWLDTAIAHHQRELIVIHGVGSGKLRDEIHEVLRLRKEVKTFVNQYHPRYGYGATQIYFQY